ncbi:MAG TPA: nicotinate (nicotinamide) nucleotide adenylyltransferase [Fibrobacteraceae bacterium]|nr:nicotinate (nicotinamide) nucleotide adenylyltransferase [Fibrobacteraceae bacterium]
MIIALFGGAFDPVHRDHLRIAESAISAGFCDSVWFTPSPDRWDKKPKAPAQHRVAMLRIALHGITGMEIRTDELEQNAYRGTYQLLRTLSAERPQDEFRLLLGADLWQTIPQWRDPEHFDGSNFNGIQLMKEFSLIIFPRRGHPMPDKNDFRLHGFRPPHLFSKDQTRIGVLASSQIRKGKNNPSGDLPEGVWEYIQTNNLYRSVG